MTERHLTRLDDDNYELYRNQAHATRQTSTYLINQVLRLAGPLLDAGIFQLPSQVVIEAVENYAMTVLPEQALLDAAFPPESQG